MTSPGAEATRADAGGDAQPAPPDATHPLRVLHVIEALGTGCARHVVDVVRHTANVEHHVALPLARTAHDVTAKGALQDLRAAEATLHPVAMHRPPVSPANGGAVLRLRQLILRLKPDVVHGHSSIGGALARAAAFRTRSSVIYTPNGLAPGWLAGAVERSLGLRAARLVAVSHSEREEVLRRRLVPSSRLVVIPNGIELTPPPMAALRRPLGLSPETPLVGTVGRVSWQKATDHFVQACAGVAERHPEVHFVLIGTGPDDHVVRRQLARARFQSRFHWIRQVPDASRYLHDLDVFVLPSRFEGGPYAPMEAVRAGVPVVLSDVVGNRDVIEDGVSGALVPPGDLTALMHAISRLITDPDLRRSYAAAATERLSKHFDVRVMGANLQALYQEVSGRV